MRHERLDGLRAEAANVEGMPGSEVLDAGLELLGAREPVGASVGGTIAHDSRAAVRAPRRHDEARAPPPRSLDPAHDLRDDIAGPGAAAVSQRVPSSSPWASWNVMLPT